MMKQPTMGTGIAIALAAGAAWWFTRPTAAAAPTGSGAPASAPAPAHDYWNYMALAGDQTSPTGGVPIQFPRQIQTVVDAQAAVGLSGIPAINVDLTNLSPQVSIENGGQLVKLLVTDSNGVTRALATFFQTGAMLTLAGTPPPSSGVAALTGLQPVPHFTLPVPGPTGAGVQIASPVFSDPIHQALAAHGVGNIAPLVPGRHFRL